MPKYGMPQASVGVEDCRDRWRPARRGVFQPAEEGYDKGAAVAKYVAKHKPEVGGYYVVYEDGYKARFHRLVLSRADIRACDG